MSRRRTKNVDYPLLWSVFLLVGTGLFILASASFGISEEKFSTPYFYLSRQIVGVLAGFALLYVAANIRYLVWKKFALPLLIASTGLLLLLFLPQLGTAYNTAATRWLTFGFVSFQPAEFIKLAFIIYLAAWLDAKRKDIQSFSLGLAPFLIIVGFVGVFLILQPDLSTFFILGVTSLFLFSLGGGKFTQIALALLVGGIAITSFIYVTGYNYERLLVFTHYRSDPKGAGYQIRQSLIAIGSGGIFGKGFGRSGQKFARLPEPVGDSIFAVFSEELGFTGNIMLFALFIIFLWRGMLIASHAPNRFGQLLAAGIISLVFVQIIVNISAFTGLLPVTGTPLPFISYGRSAMVALLGSIGILLNISRYTI